MAITEESRCFEGSEHQYYWRDLAALFTRMLGNGVIHSMSQLEVYGDTTGMQVKVKEGEAIANGYYYRLYKAVGGDADKILAIGSNAGPGTRYDRIVLRLDLDPGVESIVLAVKAGVAGGSAPTLTRTSTMHEISLAKVTVTQGAVTIAPGDVTDERTDYSVCGYAAGHFAALVGSSTNKPSGQFEGQLLYCLDDNLVYVWDSAAWASVGYIAPGSISDSSIGTRTLDQSLTPSGPANATLLTTLLSHLANRIKAGFGSTNWSDNPATSLASAAAHINAANPHSNHEKKWMVGIPSMTGANGTNTVFYVGSTGVASDKVMVFKNGLRRYPGTDYSFGAGNNYVTFTSAPPSGDVVIIDYVPA